MKTLITIQKLARLGKLLSKVVFICCIVGVCSCIVGIASLAAGVETLKIGSVTLGGIVEKSAEMSMGSFYATMAVGIILCAGEAVLSRFAHLYFRHELEDGTPFTLEGAKEMLRLGVLTVCIPFASLLLAVITHGVLAQYLPDVADLKLDCDGSFALGIMFILTSLICKYGAEICAQRKGSL